MAACISAAVVETASACQCGAVAHGQNAWENAKEVEKNSVVIFEGTPLRFELKWDLLTAREGEPIPADMFSSRDLNAMSHMVITFRNQRTYKGDLGTEVQLATGLGGGDCGATYATGLNYLVYASGSNHDQLNVSMCSPGGWIESSGVEADLRYLRKERPTSADLAPILRGNAPGVDKQQEQRLRAAEERRKQYAAATGRICGRLVLPHRSEDFRGTIAFLSTQGYSPAEYPDASINQDGSFCSRDLGPGKYNLFFVGGTEGARRAEYYPGVTEIAKAIPIEVSAGQTVSGVVFKITNQNEYSVRGFVSIDEKPDFNPTDTQVTVLLIRTDGDRRVWYSDKAIFVLPKLAYFKIPNVVPGHYAACVVSPATGWMTMKADVTVTTHPKFISLDLLRKK